ncbi:ABC transporter ATP-binding protein [Kribbella sp. NBC_00482]|uniref:ABC transporter ATP-binding protein n=1 Tax=Kribbella sp. NBC_00482 TaxID=2975968 RepID=UPI002E198096
MSTVEKLDEAVRLSGVSAYGARFTDLAVRYGEVVVLTGPNGTGKSTISRVIVGELAACGSIEVLGSGPAAAELKGRIGYLVKDLETMGSLTSRDVLDICAAVRGCGTAYAHELAVRLGLEIDRPMGQLSRGQLRRLGIVQALMHEPELIVLDDPTTELDDEARRILPALLHEAAARGAAVLVTSQSEPDAEWYADRTVQLTSSAVVDDHDNEAPAPASEPERDPEAARAVALPLYRTPIPGCAQPPLLRSAVGGTTRRCQTEVIDRSIAPSTPRDRRTCRRRRPFPARARPGGVPCRSRRRGGG